MITGFQAAQTCMFYFWISSSVKQTHLICSEILTNMTEHHSNARNPWEVQWCTSHCNSNISQYSKSYYIFFVCFSCFTLFRYHLAFALWTHFIITIPLPNCHFRDTVLSYTSDVIEFNWMRWWKKNPCDWINVGNTVRKACYSQSCHALFARKSKTLHKWLKMVVYVTQNAFFRYINFATHPNGYSPPSVITVSFSSLFGTLYFCSYY